MITRYHNYLCINAHYFSRFFSPKIRGVYYTQELYNQLFSGPMPHNIQDGMTKSKFYLLSKLMCFYTITESQNIIIGMCICLYLCELIFAEN